MDMRGREGIHCTNGQTKCGTLYFQNEKAEQGEESHQSMYLVPALLPPFCLQSSTKMIENKETAGTSCCEEIGFPLTASTHIFINFLSWTIS